MKIQTPFLVPAPKEAVFEDARLKLPRRTAAAGTPCVFTFANPLLTQELTDLFGAALSQEFVRITCCSGAVDAPQNTEQAYRLAVTTNGIDIHANTELGVLYALQTLKQLKGKRKSFQHAVIRDWPDLAFRICARPLLCAEAMRSALDWGDGKAAELARWRREIDMALHFRYNGIFVHGSTWDTECYPGFAKDMRELNRYARQRGVHLIYTAYGIGKGGWGQTNYLAEAHAFVPGLGHRITQDYPCSQNNPKDPATAYNGTCRSNPDIRKAKIEDMVAFLKAIEPGALYIHHEDHSEFKEETEDFFWHKRCPACRKKWPNDNLEALDGGAAAIADSYDVYGEACQQVKTDDGYDASRDCFLMPVSPGYGSCNADDDTWQKNETLWLNVCKLMKYQKNVYIGLREQFCSANGEGRMASLVRKVRALGCQQSIFVFLVSGAALYGENAAFSSIPEMNSIVTDGSGGLFNFSGVLFQRPQQMFNSECCWNAMPRPGGQTLPVNPAVDWMNLYSQRLQTFNFVSPRHRRANGWLANACRLFFGDDAGEKMFKYQLLQTRHGDGPLVVLYQQTSMERLFEKLTSPENPNAYTNSLKRPVKTYADAAERWKEQSAITRKGLKLVADAIQTLRGWKKKELKFHARQLAIGTVYAALVARLYRRNAGDTVSTTSLMNTWNKLSHLMLALPNNYPLQTEGDGSKYPEYLAELKKIIENPLQP